MILSLSNFYLMSFILLSTLVYYLIYTNRLKIGDLFKTNDIPDSNRKIHKNITPRTASYSLAIILLVIFVSNFYFKFLAEDYTLIIFISLFSFFIGLLDDKYELKASYKIFFLSIISILGIFLSENLIITKIYLTTYDTFFYLDIFSIPFTILCILLLTNAMNLADGINGIALSLFFYYFIFLIINSKDESLIFICCIVLINLILMFYHNFNGKHFLGDAGTLMISTLLSLLLIKQINEIWIFQFYKYSAEHIFILFMIPGLDMFRLFLKRILKKKNPFVADKSHFHHYLIKRVSLKQTLGFYFMLVNIPIFLSYMNFFIQINIIIITTLIFFSLITFLKFTNDK